MSSITDTQAREQTVDFVTYLSAGTSFFTKANAGPHVTSLADLCGRTVAVVLGTTQERDAHRENLACRKARKSDVTVAAFPDYNGTFIALESSDTAVGMADSPVASYLVKQSRGQLQLTGSYGTTLYGIAVSKRSGLATPLLHALRKLMADGTYHAILKKWGLEREALDSAQINGAAG
jgi:polar amino acid transport system substrate-binding protein